MAWVIQRKRATSDTFQPMFLGTNQARLPAFSFDWTTEIKDALQFARKRDADEFLRVKYPNYGHKSVEIEESENGKL